MSNDLSINIKSKIYNIRGKQVMFDSDLAVLYQCKNGTKEINQAVKNNLTKFPLRYSFVLTDIEKDDLRSKFLTTNFNSKSRSNPRVFTEQGVYMLATILKSKVATDVTIKIMDTFVEMRKYVSSNLFDISRALTNLDDRVKVLEESFNNDDKTGIYYEGSIYDAYSAIIGIFKKAKKSIVIIDNYIDNDTLDIVSKFSSITVSIITNKDTCYIKKIDIDKYNSEYNNLNVYYSKTYHDRFFIIDKKDVYHSGASINRIGVKTFAINKITDQTINKIFIDNINNIINNNSKEFIP